MGGGEFDAANQPKIDLHNLIRRYGWLALLLPLLGVAIASVVSVWSKPVYRSRLVAEVQGVSESFLRSSGDPFAGAYESTAVNLQTQIKLLESGVYARKIAGRIQLEVVPKPVVQEDIFGKLHERLVGRKTDPVSRLNEAITLSGVTFLARPINGTRLIELACDSTQPEVAAAYLNFMAEEFIEDTVRSRSRSSQKTSEWLSTQYLETKTNLQKAEDRLQAFLKGAGGFTGSETLDDTKLKQLQHDLASIQSARIAKQTRWEAISRSGNETPAEVLKHPQVLQYQGKIEDLRQQRTLLLGTLTANHYKVQQIDIQIRDLEAAHKELAATLSEQVSKQARSEYETDLRQEQLLQGAYGTQTYRLAGLADKAAEYNTLKREVDTLRQTYDSILQRLNQARVTNSLAVDPIRVVEPALATTNSYKSKPLMNLAFGFMGGLVAVVVIAFIRERFDSSVRAPGSMQAMFRVPELGAIPAIEVAGKGMARTADPARQLDLQFGGMEQGLMRNGEEGQLAAATWAEEGSATAESFRATVVSLIRYATHNQKHTVVLVSSAGPGEGKTTVVSNLGIALAETSRKVLLIDADMRRASLHKIFGIANDRGISTLLNDPRPIQEIRPEDYILPTGIPNLYLLSTGAQEDSVSRVIHSQRLEDTVKFLRTQFAVILIDSPPLLLFADARLLGRLTDGAVMVVQAEKTSREQATEALQALMHSGIPIIGTILNNWRASKNRMGSYYYYGSQGQK